MARRSGRRLGLSSGGASLNGSRISRKRAEWITKARVSMDAHLLDAVGAGTTRRIVYVADASCYGATSDRAITEDAPLRPSAWGRCFTPALDRVEGYLAAGLPIVTAFPGWVYGNGFLVLRTRHQTGDHPASCSPVWKDRSAGSHRFTSTTARARSCILRSAANSGGRYFLVNNDQVRTCDFAETFARLANLPLRMWQVPGAMTRLVAGPVLADHIRADAVLSNIRLRGMGFRFEYPTLEEGIQEVLGALHE